MYMLTNGIQQTEDFNNFKSNHFTAIVKPTRRVTWTTNYYFGQEQPDGARSRTGPTASSACSTPTSPTPRRRSSSFGLDVNYVTNEVNKATIRSRCRASASTRATR